jgi:hypothetical protein
MTHHVHDAPPRSAYRPPGVRLSGTWNDDGTVVDLLCLHGQMQKEFPAATDQELAAAMPPVRMTGEAASAEKLKPLRIANPYWKTTFELSWGPGVLLAPLESDPVGLGTQYACCLLDTMDPYLPYIETLHVCNRQYPSPTTASGYIAQALFGAQVAEIAMEEDEQRVSMAIRGSGYPEKEMIDAVVNSGTLEVWADCDAVLCLQESSLSRCRYWRESLNARGIGLKIGVLDTDFARRMGWQEPDLRREYALRLLLAFATDPAVEEVVLFDSGGWSTQLWDEWFALAVRVAHATLS